MMKVVNVFIILYDISSFVFFGLLILFSNFYN